MEKEIVGWDPERGELGLGPLHFHMKCGCEVYEEFYGFEDGLVNMMAVEKVRMSADSFLTKWMERESITCGYMGITHKHKQAGGWV